MIEIPEVGKTYWYCHTAILTEYPKQVTVKSLQGKVMMTYEYIGQEKFGETDIVKEGLFLTEEEANEFFIKLSLDGQTHFINRRDERYQEIYNYFVEVKPSILI